MILVSYTTSYLILHLKNNEKVTKKQHGDKCFCIKDKLSVMVTIKF